MRIRLIPGAFAAFLGIIGTGTAMAWPSQRWIGEVLVGLGVLALVFSARIEGLDLSSRFWLLWGSRQIPIHDAARIMYEAIEKTGLDDMTSTNFSSPEVALTHYKYVFTCSPNIQLYGIRPPSSQSLPIPESEMAGAFPVDGESTLRYLPGYNRPDFKNVTISRRDLRRIIREHIDQLKRLEEHGI